MKDPQELFGDTGVILAGGGLRGIAHPAFLWPLYRRGALDRLIYIGGVSVGALNGSGIAQAMSKEEIPICLNELDEIWNFIDANGSRVVFPLSWGNIHLLHTPALLSNKPLFALLKNMDPRKVRSSPAIFECTALNNTTMLHEIFSNRDPRFREDPLLEDYDPRSITKLHNENIPLLVRGIAASAALKPMYEPVDIGGDLYSDGGSIAGLVSRAITVGCKTIFVLFPYPRTYFKPQPDRFSKFVPLVQAFIDVYAAELRALDNAELKKVDIYNRNVRRDAKVSELEARLIELEEMKGGFVGRWKARLLGLRTKLDQVREAQHQIRLIPIYAEPPETLNVKSFGPGDFAAVRERADARINNLMDELLD